MFPAEQGFWASTTGELITIHKTENGKFQRWSNPVWIIGFINKCQLVLKLTCKQEYCRNAGKAGGWKTLNDYLTHDEASWKFASVWFLYPSQLSIYKSLDAQQLGLVIHDKALALQFAVEHCDNRDQNWWLMRMLATPQDLSCLVHYQ